MCCGQKRKSARQSTPPKAERVNPPVPPVQLPYRPVPGGRGTSVGFVK
jgi:hypothetical protein